MKINVLHVIYSFYTGGAEEVIVNYGKSYDKEKFNIFVCVITSGDHMLDKLRQTGVSIYILNKSKRFDLGVMRKIRGIIKGENIDILHLHNPPAQNYAIIPSFFTGVKLRVRTEHNVYYKNRVMRFYAIVNYILTLFQRKVIACSENVQLSQIRDYKLPKKKIITISNGIDPTPFEIQVSKSYLKTKYDIQARDFVILTIGNLIEQKGHRYFIQAAQHILNKFKNVTFLIVGDGRKRAELTEQISAHNLQDSIFLLGKCSDIPELLSVSDIFVLTSLWEGLPIVLLEAMAARKAIIATDVGGNSQVIIDGKSGFLIPPANSLIAAEKIEKLLMDSKLRKLLANNAYEIFIKNYTMNVMVKKTEAFYRSLLTKS